MKIYKKYGKNKTEVKYNFKKEYPDKFIFDIFVDSTYKPKKNKQFLKKRYIIKAKKRE